jgi:hypothetical protein
MPDPYADYEISRVRDYNPDTGASYVLTFAGTEAKMNEVAAHYEALGAGAPIGYGYKTTFHKTAAGIILTVRIPDEILYTTRWNFETEVTQVSIWWLPSVRDFLGYTGLDLSTLAGLKAWLNQVIFVQRAVNYMRVAQAEIEAASFTLTQQQQEIVYSIIRDGEYGDWHRPVLKRCRLIPVGLFDVRTRLAGPPLLFSLDGIYNNFGLTDDIYDQAVDVYDDLPTADPNTMWAWKMRRNDSDGVIGSGKVTEARDWVFGRWSTITNTFVE